MENRNGKQPEEWNAGTPDIETTSPNENSESDAEAITRITSSVALEVLLNDSRPLRLPSNDNVPMMRTITAFRYFETSSERTRLPDIRIHFLYVKSVNTTNPAVPCLCIESSLDFHPLVPTMRIIFFPKSIQSAYLWEARCSIELKLNPNTSESCLPKEIEEDVDLSNIFKEVTTFNRLEIFFDQKQNQDLPKLKDFLVALEGKRTPTDDVGENRLLGVTGRGATVSEIRYQKRWEAAIQEESEAEEKVLRKRLGGRIGLALSSEGDVKVFFPSRKESTHEIHPLEGEPHFLIKFPNGEFVPAFCNVDQVRKYNDSGLLNVTLSKESEEHLEIIRASLVGQFRLLPCTSEINKQQQLFTLAELLKSINEDTPIAFRNILYADTDIELEMEIDPLLESCPQLKDLDPFQEIAFRHMLHKDEDSLNVVLVSGPAGTGKTSTAACAIAAMVEYQPQRLPILVVADKYKAIQTVFAETLRTLGPDPECQILLLQSEHARRTLEGENDLLRNTMRAYSMAAKVKERGGKPRDITWSNFNAEIIGQQTIVFATIDMLYFTREDWKGFKPQMLILNEAAATNEMRSLLPWALFRQSIQRFILIGDQRQLGPYSASGNSAMETSLFQRLVISGWPSADLKMNHRMSPAISKVVKESFYPHSEFFNHPSTLSFPEEAIVREVLARIFPGSKTNAIWAKIKGPENTMASTTYENPNERTAIFRTVYELVASGIQASSIAVLSSYRGQAVRLKKDLQYMISQGLQVRTVDSYQGHEKEIVILSLVRSNQHEIIGFLGKPNRLCSATSRARFGEIIVGDYTMMQKIDEAAKGSKISGPKRGMMSLMRANALEVQTLPDVSSIDISNIPTVLDTQADGGGNAGNEPLNEDELEDETREFDGWLETQTDYETGDED
ncbi:NFX1-type zinc finger-containing protein 1 [Arthrobotrys conoides]|uniref:NFX1-type zinc finger-containing protein 1 n=1 Tax=Arthrobotrys conoides TaxID=74498 RepID=A0AAN8NNY7_9PEZI